MFTDIVKYYTQESYRKHGCCCVRLNKDKESSEKSEDSHMKIVSFFFCSRGALQRFYIEAISIAAYDHHILPHAHHAFVGLFLDFHSRLLVDKIH